MPRVFLCLRRSCGSVFGVSALSFSPTVQWVYLYQDESSRFRPATVYFSDNNSRLSRLITLRPPLLLSSPPPTTLPTLYPQAASCLQICRPSPVCWTPVLTPARTSRVCNMHSTHTDHFDPSDSVFSQPRPPSGKKRASQASPSPSSTLSPLPRTQTQPASQAPFSSKTS